MNTQPQLELDYQAPKLEHLDHTPTALVDQSKTPKENIIRPESEKPQTRNIRNPTDPNSYSRGLTQVPTMDRLREELSGVFGHYANYIEKVKSLQLKSTKFHKMMQDAGMEVGEESKKWFDLVFCGISKHQLSISFSSFLGALPLIAQRIYPDVALNQGVQIAIIKLIIDYFSPLYIALFFHESTGVPITTQESVITPPPLVYSIINSVKTALKVIYIAYYPSEIKSRENKNIIYNHSLKNQTEFITDFDICPTLLSKSLAFRIFQGEMRSKGEDLERTSILKLEDQIGVVFTFSKFLNFLIRVAMNSFSNTNSSLTEKLCFVLERMQLSKGFNNLEKRTHRPHTQKMTLLPPRYLIEIILKDKENQSIQKEGSEEFLPSGSGKGRNIGDKLIDPQIHYQTCPSPQKYSNLPDRVPQTPPRNTRSQQREYLSPKLQYYQTMDSTTRYPTHEDKLEFLSKYNDRLFAIFQNYCSFGEPTNTTLLKSAKFIKLLTESEILIKRGSAPNKSELIKVSKIDADLIFTKMTGDLKKGSEIETQAEGKQSSGFYLASCPRKVQRNIHRMSFQQFLGACVMLCGKDCSEDRVEQLVEGQIFKLEWGVAKDRMIMNRGVMQTLEILKSKEMTELLDMVYKSMLPYYKAYADINSYLKFNDFLRFARDFDIFPSICNKATLFRIHSTLSCIEQSNPQAPFRPLASARLPSKSSKPKSLENYIQSQLFIQALALCSFEVPYHGTEPSQLEKVIYLLERMAQSDGVAMAQRTYGNTRFPGGEKPDLLRIIRSKYPHFFELHEKPVQQIPFLELADSRNYFQ